jgi:membrane protein YqaA with SNARE-associated domain
MKAFVAWIEAFALSIGGLGLFLVSFLDSSFLSLPEITDVLLVWLVVEHPHRMAYYALMSTMGSIAGCFAIYALAYKGGEAFLRRRVRARHLERGLGAFTKYGAWALIVPALLPPPAPFKIFVLLAGVSRMPPARFLAAVAVGRGTRYFGEAALAYWYGRTAIRFLNENLRPVAWVTVAFLALGIVAVIWRLKHRKV